MKRLFELGVKTSSPQPALRFFFFFFTKIRFFKTLKFATAKRNATQLFEPPEEERIAQKKKELEVMAREIELETDVELKPMSGIAGDAIEGVDSSKQRNQNHTYFYK